MYGVGCVPSCIVISVDGCLISDLKNQTVIPGEGKIKNQKTRPEKEK